MNKILIALVLVVIFVGYLPANKPSTDRERFREFLNEKGPNEEESPAAFDKRFDDFLKRSKSEDKKLNQNQPTKPSDDKFFERFRDMKPSYRLFEDWKKRNPWYDRYNATFPDGSAPKLGLGIVLREMSVDGFLDANFKFNNKSDYEELDRRLGEKPLITLYKKHKESTLTLEEKAELSIDNHRQTCINIGFNDSTEGMSECIKDLYLRSLDNEKALSIEKKRKALDQKRKIEIEEQNKIIAKKKSERNLSDAIRRMERFEGIESLCKRKASVEALVIRPGEVGGFGAYENKSRRLYNQCMESKNCYSINNCG